MHTFGLSIIACIFIICWLIWKMHCDYEADMIKRMARRESAQKRRNLTHACVAECAMRMSDERAA